jgi:hypothetical protein
VRRSAGIGEIGGLATIRRSSHASPALTFEEQAAMSISAKSIALILGSTLLLLSGCPAATPTPSPTPTATPRPTTAPTATTAPTTAPTPTPEPAPTSATTDDDALLTDLAALVATSLGITGSSTSTATMGIEGVVATALQNPLDQTPYWLVHTYGLRNFETTQSHLIAIYTRQGEHWQKIASLALEGGGDPSDPAIAPDYLDKDGVTQVQIEPGHIWIQVEGGAGAHSGVYGLFSFDGATLMPQIAAFSSSPGVGKLEDLNGDGTQEVILDATDYYVFCYACGVRNVQYAIERWDGAQMAPVTITALSEAAPADLRALNDEIVQLAQAGLWKDALAALEANAPLPTDDENFIWNTIYIRYNAEAKRAATEDENMAYPLLEWLFYGDFDAAVEIMREAGADAIFIPDSPLVIGTVAEGWEEALADWISGAVEPALALKPELAAAHFLRGWATYLKTRDEAAALPEVQAAATLAPDDVLFTKSVDFLGGG